MGRRLVKGHPPTITGAEIEELPQDEREIGVSLSHRIAETDGGALRQAVGDNAASVRGKEKQLVIEIFEEVQRRVAVRIDQVACSLSLPLMDGTPPNDRSDQREDGVDRSDDSDDRQGVEKPARVVGLGSEPGVAETKECPQRSRCGVDQIEINAERPPVDQEESEGSVGQREQQA